MSRKENSNSSLLLNSSPANLGSLHKEVETNMRNGKGQHSPDDDGGSSSVSFMLEEPRSSLKEGFNIEVMGLSCKAGNVRYGGTSKTQN